MHLLAYKKYKIKRRARRAYVCINAVCRHAIYQGCRWSIYDEVAYKAQRFSLSLLSHSRCSSPRVACRDASGLIKMTWLSSLARVKLCSKFATTFSLRKTTVCPLKCGKISLYIECSASRSSMSSLS